MSCSHGVTVGNIDPEMIFYLKSRGIDTEEATRMIVKGFFETMLTKVPANFSQIIEDELEKKIGVV